MRRRLVIPLILFGAGFSLFAQEQPPAEIFSQSSRELVLPIPSGFQLLSNDRKYLKPGVPRSQRVWQRGPEFILELIVRVPDAAWKTKNEKEIMESEMTLYDPGLKIASRRDYQLDGIRAFSITCFYDTPGATSQRLDCFLVKPYLFMVAYGSPKPSSWEDPASKEFFQTIRLPSRQERSTKRPNQAMEPTTGRRTTKFSVTPISHPTTTLALASGGSSCSR
jgi:hypothetical protein